MLMVCNMELIAVQARLVVRAVASISLTPVCLSAYECASITLAGLSWGILHCCRSRCSRATGASDTVQCTWLFNIHAQSAACRVQTASA